MTAAEVKYVCNEDKAHSNIHLTELTGVRLRCAGCCGAAAACCLNCSCIQTHSTFILLHHCIQSVVSFYNYKTSVQMNIDIHQFEH